MKKRLLTMVCVLGLAGGLVACGNTSVSDDVFDNLLAQENIDDAEDDDYEDETEEEKGPQLTNLYDFAINGQVYTFPVKLGDMFDEDSLVYYENVPDDYHHNYWNHVDLYDAETDEMFGDLTLYKDNVQGVYSIEDAYAYKVRFEKEDLMYADTTLVLYGGITFESTPEEVMNVFGEPDEIQESVSNKKYMYYTLDEGNEYFLNDGAVFEYDTEGNMVRISLCHATDIMKE